MIKSQMKLIILLTLCMIPLTVSARLGETEEQSQERYGKPVKDKSSILAGAVTRTYKYEDWLIRAAFLNGKTVRIIYSKQDKKGTIVIKEEEARAILESESGNGEWEEKINSTINPVKLPDNTLRYSKYWVNTNGNLAYLELNMLRLVAETKAVADVQRKQEEEEQNKNKSNIPSF